MSYPCLPRTTPHLPHDILIPAVRGALRDLARVMGWGMNLMSVTRSWGKAEFPGISQRTASPGSVQIHVEGPNGAVVCTACSRVPMLASLIFAGGLRTRIETAMGGYADGWTSSHGYPSSTRPQFPTIPGADSFKNNANAWSVVFSWDLGVANAHLQPQL